MHVPSDFSLTYAVSPASWDREHAFTRASRCFDTLVCTPTRRATLIYWARIDLPFLEETLRDQSLADGLVQRSFAISHASYSQLWSGVEEMRIPEGVTQYVDLSDGGAPYVFIRAFFDGAERVLRTRGYPASTMNLRTTVEALVRDRSTMEAPETTPNETPKSIAATQRLWMLDWAQKATDQRGRIVIPQDEPREMQL